MPTENKLKVLIVDDTAVYRKILKDMMSEFSRSVTADTAFNGEIALRKIEVKPPDLVFLDIDMPGKDGLETLIEIKERFPQVGVVMVSGVSERQASATMVASNHGAFDFIAKPAGNDMITNADSLRKRLIPILNHFISRKTEYIKQVSLDGKDHLPTASIKMDSRNLILPPTKKYDGQPKTEPPINEPKFTHAVFDDKNHCNDLPYKIDVVCVGISTGGPGALHKFIPMLPANLGVPVLLVQHMPPEFTKSLSEHLNNKSNLAVVEASDGEVIMANKVYIAPGGKHMTVERHGILDRIAIIDTPPVQSCRPSVDVLFQSIPNCYTGNILALIMTGMGADGLDGVKALQKYSHYCITQTEESCVVYGMPRCIDEAGLSDESVSLEQMANRVVEIVKFGKLKPAKSNSNHSATAGAKK